MARTLVVPLIASTGLQKYLCLCLLGIHKGTLWILNTRLLMLQGLIIMAHCWAYQSAPWPANYLPVSLICYCRDYTSCITTFISFTLHMSLSCHCPIALFWTASLMYYNNEPSRTNWTVQEPRQKVRGWRLSPVGVSEQPAELTTRRN